MKDHSDILTDVQRDRYARLSALDSKTGSLIQVASLFLILKSLTIFQVQRSTNPFWDRVSTWLLFFAILGYFYILWFNERPSSVFVALRIAIFNAAAIATIGGILIFLMIVGFDFPR